jgi:hypothetical protein
MPENTYRIGEVLREVFPECKHDRIEVRYKVFANGVKNLTEQCVHCGKQTLSGWLPRKGVDMAQVAPFDYQLEKQYLDEMQRRSNAAYAAERCRKHEDYERYIRESPEWWAIRTKVMRRDDHLCQACRENAATDVHHKNYTHLYEEVLYDLVAVCRECHGKIHGKL